MFHWVTLVQLQAPVQTQHPRVVLICHAMKGLQNNARQYLCFLALSFPGWSQICLWGDPKALSDHLHLKVSPSRYALYKLICVWNGCSRIKIHISCEHLIFFFWSFKKQYLRTNSLHFNFQVGRKIQQEILSSEFFIESMEVSLIFYN